MMHTLLDVAPKAGTLLVFLFGGLWLSEHLERRARARRIHRAFDGRRACSRSIAPFPHPRELGRVAKESAPVATGKASDAHSSVLT